MREIILEDPIPFLIIVGSFAAFLAPYIRQYLDDRKRGRD